MAIDHTSYAVSETEGGDHTLIASDDLVHSEVILGSKKIEVIFFLGPLLPEQLVRLLFTGQIHQILITTIFILLILVKKLLGLSP